MTDRATQISGGVSAAVAFGSALVVLGIALRRRRDLAKWALDLHPGQFIIVLLPGLFAFGFWWNGVVRGNLGSGIYESVGSGLDDLMRAGITGGIIGSLVIGLLILLAVMPLLLLWLWLGERKRASSRPPDK